MKIERKVNKGLVEFDNLKEGNMFEWNDGTFWIKTERVTILNSRLTSYYGIGTVKNCVSLADGSFGCVLDSTKVKPYPKAKVILEDE